MSETYTLISKIILVSLVAFLYAAVGHGGATGYIATLALFDMPREAIASTALVLNCVVATIALAMYSKAGQLSYKLTWPFLLLSVPMAYVGARLVVDKEVFVVILAVSLVLAALRFLLVPTLVESAECLRPLPLPLGIACGAILGLLSGIIGIGGGVFLSPFIVLCRYGNLKQTSATSALFIVANSISGLVGRFVDHKLDFAPVFSLLPFAILAALAGSYLGARRFNSDTLRRLLAVVLLLAATKMLLAR